MKATKPGLNHTKQPLYQPLARGSNDGLGGENSLDLTREGENRSGARRTGVLSRDTVVGIGPAAAVSASAGALGLTSLSPVRVLAQQAIINAGWVVASFSSSAQATWSADPYSYRQWAIGAATATGCGIALALGFDRNHVAAQGLAATAPWTLLAGFAAVTLQVGIDALRCGLGGSDRAHALAGVVAGGAGLTVALGGCIASLAELAGKAQAVYGDVPVGGNQAKLIYAGAAATMAVIGTAIGLSGLARKNEVQRSAGLGLAGLGAIPLCAAVLAATQQ